eukprot:TRINITY_DN1074_c0_g1_i4.p1 TRINITY_DN1074_c0_g1~~TRINITY_DN1074_c0_g1_i4.p1  ORF type:complete len:340 (-),score=85.31 TRINITY_DN1074_c0_g1_i4:139-1158(-)
MDNSFSNDQQRNLIVNYIPSSVSEEAMRNMFFPFGEMESCKLMVDKTNGQSLGYGFVKYSTAEAASRAIAAMNGKTLDNKTLKVSLARPSSQAIQHANLYVGNLDKHMTKLALDQIFAPYGRIIDSKILIDPKTGESRGVGFVHFDTRNEAETAIKSLNGTILLGMNTPLVVKFADSDDKVKRTPKMTNTGVFRHQSQVRYDPYMGGAQYVSTPDRHNFPQVPSGAATISPTSFFPLPDTQYLGVYNPSTFLAQGQASPFCLFVYNLPQDCDDNFLYRLFGPYGAIASVKIVKDSATNKCKGFGFVNYLKYEDAQQAIIGLNGYQVGNKFLQVSFKTNK